MAQRWGARAGRARDTVTICGACTVARLPVNTEGAPRRRRAGWRDGGLTPSVARWGGRRQWRKKAFIGVRWAPVARDVHGELLQLETDEWGGGEAHGWWQKNGWDGAHRGDDDGGDAPVSWSG
jgi:hypothetical protein